MDALAAAAAVVTIHAEDYAPDEMELENAAGTPCGTLAGDVDAPSTRLSTRVEPSSADKENHSDRPGLGEQQAADPKVCIHSQM